jgi:hypothetical protein
MTLSTFLGVRPTHVECDNEFSKGQAADFMKERGVILQPAAPRTQAQNGGAERSGGVVMTKARAMRGQLPHQLWKDIVSASVYLLNRTPTSKNDWKTPFELVYGRQPSLGHLKAYGCKAYAMTEDAQDKKNRLMKLNPRAWLGYLVGYSSANIFRIWVPILKKVIRTRDVIFQEDERYDGDLERHRAEIQQLDLETIQKKLQLTQWADQLEDPDDIHETSLIDDDLQTSAAWVTRVRVDR